MRMCVIGAMVIALVVAGSSCIFDTTTHVCGRTGIRCPAGFTCAATQPVCISSLNTCANGVLDPGEECDDGNVLDGDGCSHECRIERCGNGILDLEEVCDLGDTRNGHGNGCSADCKSLERCGDRIVDVAAGEVCDDGNTKSGDGCSADCRSTE